jgi:hypothetical protein
MVLHINLQDTSIRNTVQHHNRNYPPRLDKASLETLPQELFDTVLGYLLQGSIAKKDFHAVRLTSRALAKKTTNELHKQIERIYVECTTAGVKKVWHIIARGAAGAVKRVTLYRADEYTIQHMAGGPPMRIDKDGSRHYEAPETHFREYEWIREHLHSSLHALPQLNGVFVQTHAYYKHHVVGTGGFEMAFYAVTGHSPHIKWDPWLLGV